MSTSTLYTSAAAKSADEYRTAKAARTGRKGKRLDTHPFAYGNGMRSAFATSGGQALTFAPRPKFEQDREAYGI